MVGTVATNGRDGTVGTVGTTVRTMVQVVPAVEGSPKGPNGEGGRSANFRIRKLRFEIQKAVLNLTKSKPCPIPSIQALGGLNDVLAELITARGYRDLRAAEDTFCFGTHCGY